MDFNVEGTRQEDEQQVENVENLVRLLELDALDLPRCFSTDSFEDNLRELFSAFLGEVEKVTPKNSISQSVINALHEMESVCNSLKETVSLYLQGNLHSAYEEFQVALNTLEPWLKKIIDEMTAFAPNGMRCEDKPDVEYRGDLYRIRLIGDDPLSARHLRDIFHIPFNLRHKVGSQRYSVPGLPCLYLGGSLWICWEELGRPSFHNLQVSRFAAEASTTVLDLGWRPKVVAYFLRNYPEIMTDDFVTGQILCWPLLAGCSVRRRHRGLDAPFVPEYILPQLLLQSIRNRNLCDGLRFFSTQASGYEHYPNAGANYVFPVQKNAASGYCQVLQHKFALTPPTAWSLLQISDIQPEEGRINQSWEISIGDQWPVAYGRTEFSKIEGKLTGIGVRSLDSKT